MDSLDIFLSIYSLVITISFLVSLRYLYKFSMKLLEIEDAITESLDIFEKEHLILTEISEKDIFFDSPEVRSAVNSISNARDSIHYVATRVLSSVDEKQIIEDGE